MEDLLNSSLISGLLLSTYDKFGPQPKYIFPREIEEEEFKKLKKQGEKNIGLTLRDYIQISIKNLSLMHGDNPFTENNYSLEIKHSGILPYPDFNLTSLSYFRFLKTNFKKKPLPIVLSILVDENSRSYLYNNVNKINHLIDEFFEKFKNEILEEFIPQDLIEPVFRDILLKLIDLEKRPYTPIINKRKLKIVFAGLDDSGKTSYLLSVDRKYSKLIGLKPTRGANLSSIEALGATIFLWDLGGQTSLREKILEKPQIYLYEADLVYYFIDVINKDRFNESFKYLNRILEKIKEYNQKTPLIIILSKGDSDILDSNEINENVKIIKSKIKEINLEEEPEIFITSIFSIFSILKSFSSGISKLSPNRKLINYKLKNFSERSGILLTLIVNNDGLVIADFSSNEVKELTELNISELYDGDEKNIRNIFEITAPQFTMLYKIFAKFKTLQEDEAMYDIANSTVLFKKVRISDQSMFFLFLLDDEKKIEKINKNLPSFLNEVSDLVMRYLS